MRISDWSSDVCSSDLQRRLVFDEKDAAFRHDQLSIGGQGSALGSQTLVVAAPKAVVPALVAGTHCPIRSMVRRSRVCLTCGWQGCKRRRASPRADANGSRGQAPGRQLQGYRRRVRSEEHTSELQSLMRISYAVFCLKKKTIKSSRKHTAQINNIISNILT